MDKRRNKQADRHKTGGQARRYAYTLTDFAKKNKSPNKHPTYSFSDPLPFFKSMLQNASSN